MTGEGEASTRTEWAHWFIDHDEVDEAARVLEPGDELVLGESDYRNLAAALARRGLSAAYDRRRVEVRVPDPATESGRHLTGDLAAAPRRPAARMPAPSSTAAKKTA